MSATTGDGRAPESDRDRAIRLVSELFEGGGRDVPDRVRVTALVDALIEATAKINALVP